ncbi:MAG: permease-like cell division protein FtsX [Coriobacteriales bacterium]|jgi:cell division transport system permease protein
MSRFLYFIKEALINSRRNLGTTIGGIITIFLSLLMIGVTIVFSVMIGNLATSFEDEVNVRLYISDKATDAQIQQLDDFLASMENEEGNIASVDFRDKDEVLSDFEKQTTNNPDIVKQLDGNPLPRTYVITLIDTHKVQDTVNKILSSETFTKIADNSDDPSDSVKYGQGTVERLFAVTNVIRTACIVVVILLVFISLVFLNNTIRLAILARRREISIMRLVGATNGFIRGPFVMEGALQSIVGAVLAIIVIQVLRNTLLPSIEHAVSFLPLTIDPSVYGGIYALLVVAGLIIGMVGSAIAMRRYLKV